jgi:ankyrin repeat protein
MESERRKIFEAAASGDVATVDQVLRKGEAAWDVRDENGQTVAHVSAFHNHRNALDYYFAHDYRLLSAVDFLGNTLAHAAANGGALSVINFLFYLRWDILELPNNAGDRPLHLAASLGDLLSVTFLIEHFFVNPKLVNSRNETAAHLAIANCHEDVLLFLLRQYPFLAEERDGVSNSTVFHVAAAKGGLTAVEYLCRNQETGLHTPNADGKYPLHLAVESGHFEIVRFMVNECHANVMQFVDADLRYTVLHLAARDDRLDVLKFLVDEQHVEVDVKSGDELEMTPLLVAAATNNPRAAEELVWRGANVLAVDRKKNNNILFYLAGHSDLMILKHVIFEGRSASELKVNWRNAAGRTALHEAAALDNTDFIRYMIGYRGADPNIAGYDGITPLMMAATHNRLGAVQELALYGANVFHEDNHGNTVLQYTADRTIWEFCNLCNKVGRDDPAAVRRMLLNNAHARERRMVASADVDISAAIDQTILLADTILRKVTGVRSRSNNGSSVRELAPSLPEFLRRQFDPEAVAAINDERFGLFDDDE